MDQLVNFWDLSYSSLSNQKRIMMGLQGVVGYVKLCMGQTVNSEVLSPLKV